MQGLKFIQSVNERDIDFTILEELEVSEEFRGWFSSRVYEYPVYKAKIGSWHSVNDATLGESDLVFIFGAEDDSRKAVLVENKIDAVAQPEQGKRYKLRGEKGVIDSFWEEFKTCLIAPKRYLSSAKQSEIYDAEISYEEIMSYFLSKKSLDARYAYKANLILEGIEQNRRGYQPKTSQEMTSFVMYYASILKDKSGLGMQEAKPRPAGSTWIMYYPPCFPKSINIAHQVSSGFVKAFFYVKPNEMEAVLSKYENIPIVGAEIKRNGKSIAISVPVVKIDMMDKNHESSKDKIIHAANIVEQLINVIKVAEGYTSPYPS